jgi:hypothetical protein
MECSGKYVDNASDNAMHDSLPVTKSRAREVVVRQLDGLGNQLFQYAAGRYLAKALSADLRIASELAKIISVGDVHRPVLLQDFAIRAPIATVGWIDRIVLSGRFLPRYLGAAIRTLRHIQVIRQPWPVPVPMRFEVSPTARRVYLVGHWQSRSIVTAVEPELRKEFSFCKTPTATGQGIAARIRASNASVSLHIRRGDYCKTRAFALLPLDYYDRALKFLATRLGQPECFVFSDDSAYAREWVNGRAHMHVIDHTDEVTASEDLWLMAQCQHHVIANSTFSWWGAWLNPRPNKLVIAPSMWMEFDTASIDMAASDWILLEVNTHRRRGKRRSYRTRGTIRTDWLIVGH